MRPGIRFDVSLHRRRPPVRAPLPIMKVSRRKKLGPVAVTRHILRHRRWFVGCLALGIGAGCLLTAPFHTSAVSRILVGWNVFQWCALAGILRLMIGATPEKIRTTAIAFDESDEVVLGIVSAASVAAVGCVFYEMVSGKHADGARLVAHIGLSFSTLAGLWLLVPMLFAVTYTHDWYGAPADRKTVRFPDDIRSPDYWDFVYFSMNLAVACQTADIELTSKRARRLVLIQSVLSFIFNTSVLGLTINIAAGVIS